MDSIVIVEPKGERLAMEAAKAVGNGIGVRHVGSLSQLGDLNPDFIVFSESGRLKKSGDRRKCRIALIPGSRSTELMELIDAECVVTYGMSAKDSITASSLSQDGAVLSIQRELPRLDGGIEERREIMVRGKGAPEMLMAVAGTALIAGSAYSGTTSNILTI